MLADENQPPVPLTHASSRALDLAAVGLAAQLADGLDEQEHPAHAGVAAESPPPSVLVGSAPPTRIFPSSTNAPPSPLPQNPRASNESSTIGVNAS